MKISPFGAAANNTAQITFTLCQNPLRQSISPVNTHWTTSINDGALEGGSSGGPFFDQNNRVVGQVHGGVIGCAPRIVHAGRFDVSWTGGGAANNRLSTWLTNDPNVTQTNTISMPYISGSSAVCSSGTTFTVNYVPPGGTVRWACSTNISFDNQPGNPKVFTANGTNSGWIVARIITSCNDTITLPTQVVWVGPYSSSNYPITGPSSASCRQYVYYSIPTLIGVTSINWIWPSGWTYISGQGTTNLALQTGTTGSSGTVAVQATNACGSGSYATKYTSVTGICGYSLTVSPNPATNEATIELINTVEEKATETPEWELEVFSPGQLLKTKTGKLKDKIHKLNTQGWKDGVYIVRAIINGEPLTEKLVIKQ
ncbi:MAG: hypothetical protein C0397_01880 [Odoribacter sp.]|nr:hypothetical protein [Odoribacter sp.]